MKIRVKTLLKALALALPVLALVLVSSVDAQYFGRSAYRGYFSGTYDAYGTYVFPQGSSTGVTNSSVTRTCGGNTRGNGGLAVTSSAGFKGTINSRLGSSNSQLQTGAAFILNTMLGISGSSASRNPGSADADGNGENDLTQWNRLVDDYTAAGLIDYNVCDYFPNNFDNSFYQGTRSGTNPNDDSFYNQNGSEYQLSIIVYDPNDPTQILFQVKQNCGNPAGNLRPFKEINTNEPPVGSFTTIGGDICRIQGWALDEDYAGSIRVAIRRDSSSGTALFNGQANRSTPDPPRSYRDLGYNNNGFLINLPDSYKDGRTYTIYMNMVDVDSSGSSNGNFPTLPSQTIRCNPLTYDLSITSITGVPGPNADPGTSGTARVTVRNSGNGASSPSPGSVRVARRVYRVPGSNISGIPVTQPAIIGANSSRTFSVSWSIPNDDVIPDQYCVAVSVYNHEGITNGAITNSGRLRQVACEDIYTYDITDIGISAGLPTYLDPGQTGTSRIVVRNSGDGSSRTRYHCGSPSQAPRVARRLFRASDNSTVGGVPVSNCIVIGAGGSASYNLNWQIPTNATAGEEYCVAGRVHEPEGVTNGRVTNSGSVYRQDCGTVTAAPYFGVDRGSIFAGLEMGSISPGTDEAFIATKSSTSTGDWIGGVSEFAALALGEISGFSSTVDIAQVVNTSDGPNNRVSRLTFANTPGTGNFGEPLYLQADVYTLYNEYFDASLDEHAVITGGSERPTFTSFRPFSSDLGYMIYRVDGDLDLARSTTSIDFSSAGGVDNSQDILIFVDGDVEIQGNILAFSDSGYSSVDDIPSFTVIATGDINIRDNVTRMDGTYIAYGDFNSCVNQTELSTSRCNRQLEVNGVVAANRFLLKRTYGSTNRANPTGGTNPAEIFRTAPEVYLSAPPSPGANLPGVTSLVDLPPLF
jgi:hypothetical protein